MLARIALCGVAAATAAAPAVGQDWCELQKFTPDGRVPGDYFGNPVIAMTSQWALITARDTDTGTFPAYAVMYERSGDRWVEHPRIASPRPEANIGFAIDAGINDDWAMIGAPREDIGAERLAGCVYVYRRDGREWTIDLDRTLTEPTPLERNGFGFGVTISGDWAAARNRYGLVHVFRFDGDRWTHHQQFKPDFGAGQIAMDGDTMLIGTPAWTDTARASIYRLDPITEQWLLEDEIDSGVSAFAGAVALHGSLAVLASRDDVVSLYRRSGSSWAMEEQVLGFGGLYGWSVACHDNTLIIGARGRNSAYWYEHDGAWRLRAEIKGSDPSTSFLGGGTVAVLDDIVLAGAPGSPDGGLAYAFRLGSACGCYADCDGSGALDLFDFLCFQNMYAVGDPEADCDASGALDFFDFLCFQNEFAGGCS